MCKLNVKQSSRDLLCRRFPEEGFVHGETLQLIKCLGQRGTEEQSLPVCWDCSQNHLEVLGEVSTALLQQPVSFVQNLSQGKQGSSPAAKSSTAGQEDLS